MKLAWAGYGLLGMAATGTLALALVFRSFEASREPSRHELCDLLEPVAEGEDAWLGTYRLYSEASAIVLEPDGVFTGETRWHDPDEFVCSLPVPEPVPGSWEREGSVVRLVPGEKGPSLEFELGRLEGEYVLLSEFSAWHRVPDAAVTSSSR